MTPDVRELARIAGTEAGCANARKHGRDDWSQDDERLARVVERLTLDRLTQPKPENSQ